MAIVGWTLTSAALAQHGPVVPPSPADVTIPAGGDNVPMLDFGGRPVVEVAINGKGPYKLIFDTGASINVVDSTLAAELSLDSKPTIQEVRVGKIAARNVPAFVNPISQMLGSGDVPRGVLSASSFPGNLVIFDYPSKKIRFRRGALAQANGKNIFAYDAGDLPSLPVKVAGHEITVHLDTGAPYPLALPTKYIKELPLTAPPVQKGSAKTHGGVMPIFQASLDGDVAIGEFELANLELRFTDVVPFATAEPKGQVGNEALRKFVVTLDSMNHRIRLERITEESR
jgi:Aspartyl protease